MSDEKIITRERYGAILVGTINRAENLNALSKEVLGALADLVADFEHDQDSMILVITGAGKAFVAGADISEMAHMSVLEAREFSQHGQELCSVLGSIDKLVVAAVNGFALGGGCELALACDLVYASEKAKFGQPEVKLGVIPGFGGTQRLTRMIGPRVAMELLTTGRIIGADEAKALGLVNDVYPIEGFLTKVIEVLRPILAMGPIAVGQAKLALHRGQDIPLDRALAMETEMFASLFATEDQKEGMAAFAEKRRPEFSGN
jgi:enoyl-CoA hydratase